MTLSGIFPGPWNASVSERFFGYLAAMLSRKTKYGIKALAHIAASKSEKPLHISVIAEKENIPRKFLEAILLTLRKNGFLGSKRGKGGGYYLIKDPSEIPMTTVIRILEGPIALVPCVSLNFYEKCHDCPDEHNCPVHKLMLQVRDSALYVYRNNTLADII